MQDSKTLRCKMQDSETLQYKWPDGSKYVEDSETLHIHDTPTYAWRTLQIRDILRHMTRLRADLNVCRVGECINDRGIKHMEDSETLHTHARTQHPTNVTVNIYDTPYVYMTHPTYTWHPTNIMRIPTPYVYVHTAGARISPNILFLDFEIRDVYFFLKNYFKVITKIIGWNL